MDQERDKIMRWGYKTVQYELKKEGLLGSSFLDEAEIEQSFNEFGQAGWELVSLFAMRDGLMAVFKQPLEMREESIHPSDMTGRPPVTHLSSQSLRPYDADGELESVDRPDQLGKLDEGKRKKEVDEEIGSIRIE